MNEKNKDERVKYCQKLINNNILGRNIFFTDETQIKCTNFVNERIRLSKKNTEKLKKGNPEDLKLIEMEEEKFPKSIMLAGVFLIMGLVI